MFHINVLDLKAAKLTIIFFTLKKRDSKSVHIPMDNMTALPYLRPDKTRIWPAWPDQKPGVDCDQQRNLAIPFEAKGHDYCQILTRVNECRGRQGIQANQ